MNTYKNNILISSLPKSGTILTIKIIQELTNLKGLGSPLNNDTFKSFLNKFDNNRSKVMFGGINEVTKEEILISANFHNEKNAICHHLKFDISSTLDIENSCIYAGHALPASMLSNQILKNIPKKIYVYRYGLDAVNSKMKFIENLDYIYELMEVLKSQNKYQKLRYATISKYLKAIEGWAEHTQEYLNNRDNFYGINYENLIENPYKEIKKLTEYLDIKISKNRINEIIEKLFYRELSADANSHKHYKHYNNSKKVSEWIKFIPYSFYINFEKKYSNILKDLGYDKKIKMYNNNKFHNIFMRKLNLFKKQKDGKNSINLFAKTFINTLNIYLDKKKIAIYGSGNYSKFLQSNLNSSVEIVMVCDDDFKKLKDKLIISPTKLLKNILNYDYILIAANTENKGKIKNNIKEVLKLHGGIEVVDGFNEAYYQIYLNSEIL